MQITVVENAVAGDSLATMPAVRDTPKAEQYSTSECFDGWRKPIKWTPSDLAERMGAIGPCKGLIVRFSHHGGR